MRELTDRAISHACEGEDSSRPGWVDNPVGDVSWTAIRRHLVKRDWSGCLLQIKLSDGGDPEGTMFAIDAAIEVANGASERDHPDDRQVWAGGAVTSLKGPMIGLDWVGEEPETRQWVETLASELSGDGYDGEVTAAPVALLPQTLDKFGYNQFHIFGFAAFRRQGSVRKKHRWWDVDPDTSTALVADAVAWAEFARADVYLQQSVMLRVDVPTTRAELTRNLQAGHWASAIFAESNPVGANSVAFGSEGKATFGSLRQPENWRHHVDRVRQFLIDHHEPLELGMVRYASGATTGWPEVAHGRPVPRT